MSIQNIYVVFFLILVIIISQIFAIILSINMIREGICLPDCGNVNYDYDNTIIPPCKKIVIKLLDKRDAETIETEIINSFITNINNYIVQKYTFFNIIESINNNNNNNNNNIITPIRKYFTDFSGIQYHTNQDILDNMVNDPNFETNLNYVQSNNSSIINMRSLNVNEKQIIITVKESYLIDMSGISTAPANLITLTNKFLQDISGKCIEFKNRCDDYYTEQSLIEMINQELAEPTAEVTEQRYKNYSSSFHKVSNYIYKSKNGTLLS